MNVTIITLGKLKESCFKEASTEYEKRLSAYCKLKVIELVPVKLSQNPSEAEVKAALIREAELISRSTPKSFKVALCSEGERLTSEQFAKLLLKAGADLSFVTGSSGGLAESVKNSADMKLSLSDMTLPYQLARIVLTEQLYRAFSINNNGKYHK
ncbi:MAG: 23S rRNA (pseudouridine(1915)-N(3))-methyltransferase RlmH [Oscillospiraceae bacterium]|jgi:23S rRNA (pseudouridine1915-N3)-methyltransferase|nr:23S rRNA (pseudouridine(1915)-N(3))-methyltransferase RlmH [Oscillospiraceae bacterium]